MKLIFFSQHFFPENFRINEIVFGLVKKFKINVFTGRPNYHSGNITKKFRGIYLKRQSINNVKVFRFPIISRGNSLLRRSINYLSYIISGSFYSFLLKKDKSTKKVIVYATSPFFQVIPAIIYAKLNKAKLFYWIQDLWPETLVDLNIIKKGFTFFILNKFINFLYSFADCILVPSEGLKKNLKLKVKKIPVFLYHNPSNLKFQKKTKLLVKKNFTITFSGNLGKAQDFESLVTVLNKNLVSKNIYFNIIGNGSKSTELKQKLNKQIKKKRVNFKSFISQKKLNKILNRSDAYFITLKKGYSFDLIIPGKFSTYLSFGKPILGNCCGDLYKIIRQNKIGFASKQNNYKELAKNINKLQRLNKYEKLNIYKNCKKLFSGLFDLQSNLVILEKYLKKVK